MGLGRRPCFIVMMSLTTGLFLVELVVGNMTNSMALIADSFHMLSDLISLAVGYFALQFTGKRDRDVSKTGNTYGWVRAGVLGALINAVFLIALCLSIFINAIKRFISVEQLERPILILSVGSLGFAVNIIGMFLFYGHTQSEECQSPSDSPSMRKSQEQAMDVEKIYPPADDAQVTAPNTTSTEVAVKKTGSNKSEGHLVMKVVLLDKMGDALGSIIVIIAALIIHFVGHHKWTLYIDPALSLIMTCIILNSSVPLLKESSLILLQNVPPHIQVKELENRLLESFPEIISIHDFHVWQLAGNKIVASAHMKLPSRVDYDRISANIKEFFHYEGIHSTTFQPEFQEDKKEEEGTTSSQCSISCVSKSCEENVCCLQLPDLEESATEDCSDRKECKEYDEGHIPTLTITTAITTPVDDATISPEDDGKLYDNDLKNCHCDNENCLENTQTNTISLTNNETCSDTTFSGLNNDSYVEDDT